MARIPTTTFKQWKDGDVVNAKDYTQELEILRTAINSTDDDVSILKGAAEGTIKRVPSAESFTADPKEGDVLFRSDLGILYVVDADLQWIAISPKDAVDKHIESKENPHGVTSAQVGAYSTTEADGLFVKGPGSYEVCTAILFTNGASNKTTATVTFKKPYVSPPVVMPANITIPVSYANTLMYPYIYNVTKSGFSVEIQTVRGEPLGGPTAANIFMNFIAIGK